MRSPHSGLHAGVLSWECLYRADTVILLGAFGVGTGVVGLALRVTAVPVLGMFVCVGIGFRRSRVWQISFWCSPIVRQAFGWWGLVSVCVCTFRCGWSGCSVIGLGSLGVTLGVFLFHCVLWRAGGFYSAGWRGLMDDEASSHYVFLFMLLLIAFLVIDLSIKANISSNIVCCTSDDRHTSVH